MKRLRPVNSCVNCRKRRLKCDREHPWCGRCRQNNQRCVYIRGAVVTGSGAGSELSRTKSDARRLSILAEQPNRDRGRFSVSYGGRTSYNGATFWGNAISANMPNIDELVNSEETPPAPVNRLSTQPLNDNMALYHGPFRLPTNSQLNITASTYSTCHLCGHSYRISCIQALLPDQATCEKLCLIFFGKIFSLIPILHLPSFRADFDELWQHLNGRKLCHSQNISPILRRKPGFLCLLFSMMFSVLYCTSETALRSVFGGALPEISTNTCYLALTVVARLTNFPRRPTTYTLAAYIYSQSQFAREEEFRDAPEFVGMSFRLAIGMGLHRQLFDVVLEVSEIETRRRLWWYVLHLDAMVSSSSGLPPLFIDEKMSNVDAIDVFDEFFDSTKAVVERKEDIRYIVAAKRYEASREIRDILRLHFEDAFNDHEVLTAVENRLAALADSMERTCEDLLRTYSRCSSPASAGGDLDDDHHSTSNFSRIWNVAPDQACDHEVANFALWSVLLLHLMVHKTYCILYHPLFYQSSTEDTDLRVNYSAVNHAQAFLHLFVLVCSQSYSEPYRWMYPGTYQPLQALALLVADLLRNPRSDTSEMSRGVIDRVFEIYSIDHGIVNPNEPLKRNLSANGRHVWLMLARARGEALERVEEDPHVLIPFETEDLSKCLCGQSIGVPVLETYGAQAETTAGPSTPQRSEHDNNNNNTQSNSFLASQPSSSQHDFGDPFMGDTEFDWRDFEAISGAASSYVS